MKLETPIEKMLEEIRAKTEALFNERDTAVRERDTAIESLSQIFNLVYPITHDPLQTRTTVAHVEQLIERYNDISEAHRLEQSARLDAQAEIGRLRDVLHHTNQRMLLMETQRDEAIETQLGAIKTLHDQIAAIHLTLAKLLDGAIKGPE